jgi:hypothetical protein
VSDSSSEAHVSMGVRSSVTVPHGACRRAGSRRGSDRYVDCVLWPRAGQREDTERTQLHRRCRQLGRDRKVAGLNPHFVR